MKNIFLISLLFVFSMPSCKPTESTAKRPSFSPLKNGFGVVSQWIGIDSGPGAEFYYKGTNANPVLVWPSIGTGGDPILYTNDIALLLADKPDAGGSFLIVVEGVGPAMDISDDVLKIAAEQNRVEFKRALKDCAPSRLHQLEDIIEVLFVSAPPLPSLKAKISWGKVFEIMKEVKATGKTNKVVGTDVLYLQKDYRH